MRSATILLLLVVTATGVVLAQDERGPRMQPGTKMQLYAPEQHELYDGHFVISGSRIYQVGTLDDRSPWDHMGDDASNLRAVQGTVDLDVNEIENSGTFRAELDLPEGHYVVELDRFNQFSPCQDGGIAAYLFEHGNSGCGDMNWPKSLLYVAGWGYGHATLNGELLYEDYEMHFMVTQGMRDRDSLKRVRSTRLPSNSTFIFAAPKGTMPTIRIGKSSITSSLWKSRGADVHRPAADRIGFDSVTLAENAGTGASYSTGRSSWISPSSSKRLVPNRPPSSLPRIR